MEKSKNQQLQNEILEDGSKITKLKSDLTTQVGLLSEVKAMTRDTFERVAEFLWLGMTANFFLF